METSVGNQIMKRFFYHRTCADSVPVRCGLRQKGRPCSTGSEKSVQLGILRAAFTANGCLAVSALMGGATQNVDGFSIELEPLSAKLDSTLPPELQTQQDTCEGCPFTPRRRQKSRLRKLSPSMWAPGTPLPTAPKPRLRPIAGDWSPAASFGPIPTSLRRFRQFADRTILEKSA